MAVSAQHDVVSSQRVCSYKKAQVAFNDAALVFSQTIRVFPKRDIAAHVYLLRHPMVGASRQVLFPSPFVFEWNQLVHIGLAIDDALICCIHTALNYIGSRICSSCRWLRGCGLRCSRVRLWSGDSALHGSFAVCLCAIHFWSRWCNFFVPTQHSFSSTSIMRAVNKNEKAFFHALRDGGSIASHKCACLHLFLQQFIGKIRSPDHRSHRI